MMNDFGNKNGVKKGRIQNAVDSWEREADIYSYSSVKTNKPKDEENKVAPTESKIDARERNIKSRSVEDYDVNLDDVKFKEEKHDDDTLDVKDIIKNNFKEISADKKAEKKAASNVDLKAAKVIEDSEATKVLSSTTPDFNSSFKAAKTKKDDVILSETQKAKRTADKIRFNQEKKEQQNKNEEDTKAIINEQKSLRNSLILKFVICLICTGFLAFFVAAPIFNFDIPPIIDAMKHPKFFLACNMAFLLIIGIVGFSVAVKGIASLFLMRPDADSITSLAFYGALIGNIYLFVAYVLNGTPGGKILPSSVFTACAAAAVTFNLFGKIFIVARIKNNLDFLNESGRDSFYSALNLEPEEAKAVYKIFDGEPNVVTTKKVKYVSDYLDQAYSESPSDVSSKHLSLTVAIIALAGTLVYYVLKHDIAGAIILFTAICAVGSPLLLEFGVSLPFYRTCKRLTKQNTLITGCTTLAEFNETDAVIADSAFLFTNNGIKIHGIKTFSNAKIDDCILYASSIAKTGKSPLYSAFAGMFADKNSAEKMLLPAERLNFEDERGLYAIINDKSVLLGNRKLLRHHLVESPSRDFEIRNSENGKDIVYLAIDGVLCAMFIVEYNFNDEAMKSFRKLRHYGIHLLIDSTDPNVTPLLLEEKTAMTSKSAFVLGAKEMNVLRTRKDGGINASGLAFKDAGGYIAGIISCIKLNAGIMANTSLQFIFSVVGALIVICCALFGGGIETMSPAYILGFQILSAIPVVLISLFRRN